MYEAILGDILEFCWMSERNRHEILRETLIK